MRKSICVKILFCFHLSLTQVIRRFSGQLDDWLHQALDSLPQSLQKVKFDCKYNFTSYYPFHAGSILHAFLRLQIFKH